MNDTLVISMIRGRIGAAIMTIIALVLSYFGYTLAPDDQTAILDLGVAVTAGIATVLTIYSRFVLQRMISKIAAILELLLGIVSEIISQLKKKQKKETEISYQEEADNAKTDIIGALNSHFNGVSSNSSDSGKAKAD